MGLFSRQSKASSTTSDQSRKALNAESEASRLLQEGIEFEQQGNVENALHRYQLAVELMPELARAHFNCGTIFLDRGDAESALAAFTLVLKYKPDSAAAHYNMGNAHFRLVRYEAAVECYRHAIDLKSDFSDAHIALGITYENLRNISDAIGSYRSALRIKQDHAEVHLYLANILKGNGQLDEAVASYKRLLNLLPNHAIAHFHLGTAQYALEQYDNALANFRCAVEIQPDYAEAHSSMGELLHAVGKLDDAVVHFQRALELRPDWLEVQGNLGNVFKDQRRLEDAVVSYRRVLELQPDDAKAHNNLGSTLTDLGQINAAIESYRRALEIDPDFLAASSGLLFSYNYLAEQSAPFLFDEAQRYGSMLAKWTPALPHACTGTSEVNRRLRIGFVSGDLREHSVGFFIEGVLTALASDACGRLEVFAYPTFNANDAVAIRIKAQCKGWYSAMGITDQDLAQRIQEDRIDILIDLSGHTAHNRLPVFAWKPAPVQVTWLGYLATTGVAAIDYVLADAWTLPVSEEINFTEKVWRLPESYLCFTPPESSIEVGPLPALANGYVTFGSFNNLSKVNKDVVTLWARVLHAVPGSRLYLKSPQLKDVAVQQSTRARFAEHGIDEGRLTFEGLVPRSDYLKPFQRVDIALDPFPYPGITTSVENLWMGVPVITLAGKSFLSRQGVGLMMNAGLPEWIASDADDYVARAVSHSNDLQRLATLRSGLREQVQASPIFDASRFARNFEAAMRGMWEVWCATHSHALQQAEGLENEID